MDDFYEQFKRRVFALWEEEGFLSKERTGPFMNVKESCYGKQVQVFGNRHST